MRIFENRINTRLFIEKPEKMNVIVGNYDNSNETYINDVNKSYFKESQLIKVVPSGDGKKFFIEPYSGYKKLGVVSQSVPHNRVFKFKDSVVGKYSIGDKIYIKYDKKTCMYNDNNTEGYYIYTIDDPDDIRNQGLVQDPIRDIVVTSPILSDYSDKTVYIYSDFKMPNWIEKNAILSFEFIGEQIEFDTIYTEEDGDVLITETRDIVVKNLFKVDEVSREPINSYFTVGFDTKIYNNSKYYKISRYSEQNKNGTIDVNSYGVKVNFSLTSINNGEFIKCSKFNVAHGGLLIYDKLKEVKSGIVSYDNLEDVFIGENTKFEEEFSAGDCFTIEGYDDIVFTIESIIDNYKMTTVEKNIGFSIDSKYIYKTNKKIDSIETIIYSKYDDSNNISQGNFKNIIPIRGNMVMCYKFGAYEKNIRNVSGNKFKIDFDLDLYEIYKVWLNGRFIELNDEYEINKKEKTIDVNEDISDLRRYNNYLYLIYYMKEQNQDDYVFLEYEGYKTSFPSKDEYLYSLKEFKYYINFSESQNYNYYEYEDKVLDVNKRTLIDKRHNISFSSYISNDSLIYDSNIITNDLVNIVGMNKKFRIIRYNYETKIFYVYNDCKIVNPPSDSINDDVNIITYSVDYKDKISIGSRPFGEGEWGRFELFGLKILSVD